MKRDLLTLVALTALAAAGRAQAAEADVQLFKLREGAIQWGAITAHDEAGFTFRRLDTGGVVRLPWGRLDPAQEVDLKTRFGYVDLTGDEVIIDADRLVTSDGEEHIGKILGRTDDAILFKTATATIPIPKARIHGAATVVQVPARQVYSAAELYAQQLAATDLATAQGQWDLARYCERILDFQHALDHFRKAAELDPGFQADKIAGVIARTQEKAASQEQLEYLAEIDLLLARKKFDEALVRAEAFGNKFPGTALLPEAKKRKDRILKARDRFLVERVAQRWHFWAARVARDAGTRMTYEQALAYLEEQMKLDVVGAVTREMQPYSKDCNEDVVRRMWRDRKKVGWKRASYGLGTWLLGKERALAGEEPEKEDAAEASAKDKERADLEAKIRQFLQNQEMVRKAQSAADQQDDREKAWSELPSISRAGWILAYYAEFGGDMEFGKPLFDNCRECGGKGTRVVAITGANVSRSARGKASSEMILECESCHGLGRVRRITYR